MRPLALALTVTAVLTACTTTDSAPETTGFVPLGTIALRATEPAELGTPAATLLAHTLRSAEARNIDAATALLTQPTGSGRRGFAFVLPGCAETGASLTIEGDRVTARLTGGDNTNCAAARYFLATFEADADRVPPSPRLG